jgi:hypothetical protein
MGPTRAPRAADDDRQYNTLVQRGTMAYGVPETDWKVFSELRKVALERFCARVLEEIEAASSDASRSYHERYLTIYQLLQKRDKELALAFNDPRRSGMMIQLVALHMYGLLQPEEWARFTPQTRTGIESVVAEARRARETVKPHSARSAKEW